MDWLAIGLTACLASALTLFSGFGLGTLLLPAFALFFPVDLAVAMTAVLHQGALRSAFLLRAGLSKEAFIATGVVIACLVDFSRLSQYGRHLPAAWAEENRPLLAFAMASAWTGVVVASRFLHKVTWRTVQVMVAALLSVIALLLGAGLI